jgi:hypothetical protein
VVVLVQGAVALNGWEATTTQLLLGALFVVTVLLAHGLRRVVASG